MDCFEKIRNLCSKARVSDEDVKKLEGCEDELIEAFKKEEDCNVRKKLVFAMGILGVRFAPYLKEALKDECPWVRGYAAEMLGKIGVEDDELVNLLKDSCPWVRHRTLDGITYLCENPEFARKVYRYVLERLEDSSPYVQNYAIQALKACLKSLRRAEMHEEADEIELALKEIDS